MSDLIKKLFGGSSIPEDLPLELRSILSQMRHERNTFEALTQQASGSIKRAEELEAPVERAYGVFADLEKKLLAFERLAPTLDQLEGRAQQLSEANREVEERAGQAASTVERFEAELEATREELQNVRDEMTDVRELMSAVMAIKQDVTNVLELGEAFRTLRADMDELSTEVRSFGGRFGEIQAKHTAIAKAGDDAEKRIARMESRFGKVTSGLEEAEGRAEALKEVVAPVEELIQRVPETRRDLQTLKALGDYVSQRISQIEQQREVVERYAGQAERLSGLMKQLDRETEKQRENQKFVEQMHERVKEIRSTHVEIEQSTETLVARQKAIDAHAEEQQAAMQALRDGVMEELKNASARFHFDKEGLEALSQRVADLKDAVVDVESRLPAAEEAVETVEAARDEAQRLAAKQEDLAEAFDGLDEQAERARRIRSGFEGLEARIKTVVDRMEEVRAPDLAILAAAEERVQELKGLIETLEDRAEVVEAFAKRVKDVGKSVEQRQSQVEEALESLEAAAEARQKAETAAEQWREHAATVQEELDEADQRMTRLGKLYAHIEGRSEDLDATEKLLQRFEERFAEWEKTEERIRAAVEQAASREKAVDALRSELKRLTEMADRTSSEVHMILEAREEIAEERETMDAALEELRALREQSKALEERNKRAAELEEHAARLDALIMTVGSTLETLESQRAFLDQVIETAGSLRFQSKHAEALIESLREEREQSRERNGG